MTNALKSERCTKIGKNDILTFRWEIYRKQREVDKAEQSEVERKKMFKVFYAKYMHAFYVIKSIFNVYNVHQQAKILEHRRLY